MGSIPTRIPELIEFNRLSSFTEDQVLFRKLISCCGGRRYDRPSTLAIVLATAKQLTITTVIIASCCVESTICVEKFPVYSNIDVVSQPR